MANGLLDEAVKAFLQTGMRAMGAAADAILESGERGVTEVKRRIQKRRKEVAKKVKAVEEGIPLHEIDPDADEERK